MKMPSAHEKLLLAAPRGYCAGVGAAEVTVAAHPRLARAMRDREGAWAPPAVRAAFGAGRGLELSVVPVAAAGEPLGAIVFCFNEAEPHDADNRRLLDAMSAAMGFAMLRDRLAGELERAAG